MRCVVLLFVIAAILESGCAKQDQTAAAPTPAPGANAPVKPVAMTPEAYGPRLKAILAPTTAPIAKASQELDPTKLAADYEACVGPLSDGAAAVKAITPPAGAEAINRAFVSMLEDTSGIYSTTVADLKAGKKGSPAEMSTRLGSMYKTFSASLKQALQAGGWDEKAFTDDPPRLVKAVAAPKKS